MSDNDHPDNDNDEFKNNDDDLDFDPNDPLPPSNYFGRNNNLDGPDQNPNNDNPNNNNNNNNNPNLNPNPSYPSLNNNNGNNDPSLLGDVLPAFASQENRQKEVLVKNLEKTLQKVIDDLESNSEAVTILKEHLKNVEQEHLHTAALVEAKSREAATEKHLLQLAEREAGRVASDISLITAYSASVRSSLNSIENASFSCVDKLDAFKLAMNWNSEELLQWSLAARQKDEDREALKKYEKQDSVELNKLTLKFENMTRLLQDKKRELEVEITETQAVQIELDKTAEEYKAKHQAKSSIIRQWDEATRALHQRDRDIFHVSELHFQERRAIEAKESEIHEQKQLLAQEQANLKSLNVDIGAHDRLSEKKRNELNEAREDLIAFQDQVSTQRSELEKAESELRTCTTVNASLADLKKDRSAKLEALKQAVDQARSTLDSEYLHSTSLAERAKQVEALHAETVARMTAVNRSLATLKESMFKHSHLLFEKRKQEADLIASISGAQGTSRNLQQRIHSLDQRSLKQQEMLYNIEFQVQQLERRRAHAEGKRSLEDTINLNARIATLEKEKEQLTNVYRAMQEQVKRVHDELRAAKRAHEAVELEINVRSERLSSIQLENVTAENSVKEAAKAREAIIVEHDLLKLEVTRLRTQLSELADQVLIQENRRSQLALSMRERDAEIALSTAVQKAEGKNAEDARHAVAMDLRERQIKLEKLKNKFETIAAKLKERGAVGEGDGTNTLDNGEDRSQAYYIIAAAVEREELQREGDALDAETRKCERELAALSNTQALLNGSNAVYRAGFARPATDSEEMKMAISLEEQVRAMLDKVYKSKQYSRECGADVEGRKNVLAGLINGIGANLADVSEQEAKINNLRAELSNQEQALERAIQHCKNKQTAYRNHKKKY